MFSKPGYAALAVVTEPSLKESKNVEKHTSNRPENSHKAVRLPIVNHVIVHPGIIIIISGMVLLHDGIEEPPNIWSFLKNALHYLWYQYTRKTRWWIINN